MPLFSLENVLVCPIFTVKPVHNDHPCFPKKVAIVDRWSLLGGHLDIKGLIRLQNSGRCRQVVAIWRWSLAQV